MQIVIDIDENVIIAISQMGLLRIPDEMQKKVDKAIQHGTPLPKGHGDLIYRTEAIKNLFDYHNGKKTIGQCIDDVPTIIEADKEE